MTRSPHLARFNWALWLALPLALATLFTYSSLFVKFPATRDIPWVNLLFLSGTIVALIVGLRRAFAPERRWFSKLAALAVAAVSLVAAGLFVYIVFISARRLPPSSSAPAVGQRAPEFTLADLDNKPVSLPSLLSTPLRNGSTPPRGTLLIFYRGYW